VLLGVATHALAAADEGRGGGRNRRRRSGASIHLYIGIATNEPGQRDQQRLTGHPRPAGCEEHRPPRFQPARAGVHPSPPPKKTHCSVVERPDGTRVVRQRPLRCAWRVEPSIDASALRERFTTPDSACGRPPPILDPLDLQSKMGGRPRGDIMRARPEGSDRIGPTGDLGFPPTPREVENRRFRHGSAC
jgi:hypothetical protein